MSLRIHSPEGAVGAQPRNLAPAPSTLRGLRIAALDNGKPGADVLLQAAAQQLAERSGAIYTGLRRKGSAATPCEDALFAELARSADLVLTGTAD